MPVDPAKVVNVNHCQPLQYRDRYGQFVTQEFVGAQWYKVIPFALTSGDALRSLLSDPGPPTFGTKEFVQEAADLVAISANLTDEQQMIAEYWSDGPNSEQPPGHWDLFGQFVSARDRHTLDDDVKLFLALSNGVSDAGIAAWDAKRAFDSVRPVTSIPYLFNGKKIMSWAGPGLGTRLIDGWNWIPYQPSTFPTPPFPEYISGHSAFSAAGARILKLFTGSDSFDDFVTLPAGSSKIEPGITPRHDVTLKWATFREAANEAGISRRYGGIHFELSDLAGRTAGRIVADQVWAKAVALWSGAESEHTHDRDTAAAERPDQPH